MIGAALVAVPYLFILWDCWGGGVHFLRRVGPSNFYEVQAEAIMHGRLYLPAAKIGIEGFIHDGHTYTYFGIFPSLIRIPVMLLFPTLDTFMTGPFILVAWIITGVFTALLIWRVRVAIAGPTGMGRLEAASYGALMGTVLGGSVLLFLAANPWVYDEDLAWSVALCVASLFAILLLVERPSTRRVLFAGFLVLCTSLNRLLTGWSCILAMLLVAVWFAFGRDNGPRRKWAWPTLGAALLPVIVSCWINWVKFGELFGLPLQDQVWTSVSAHRRHFLAVNHGAYSFRLLATNLHAYLDPLAIHFTTLFPYITLPTAPPGPVGGAVLDQSYPTGGVPATMPLLFLLALWGVIATFRRRPEPVIRGYRAIVFGAALAPAGLFFYGYITERYLADFLPFLVVAGVVGLVDLWARARGRCPALRRCLLASTAVLAAFCVAANVGLTLASSGQWTPEQGRHFVSAQEALSLTSLRSVLSRGAKLPYWAPANQLFEIGNCSSLYLSTGYSYTYSPGQQAEHATWIPLLQPAGYVNRVTVTFVKNLTSFRQPVPLMRYGAATLFLEPKGRQSGGFAASLVLKNSGISSSAFPFPVSQPFLVKEHKPVRLPIMTDPNLHLFQIGSLLKHYLGGTGPPDVVTTALQPPDSPVVVTSKVIPPSSAARSVCRALPK